MRQKSGPHETTAERVVKGIRRKRIDRMRAYSNLRWHLDELFVKINDERHYMSRAIRARRRRC